MPRLPLLIPSLLLVAVAGACGAASEDSSISSAGADAGPTSLPAGSLRNVDVTVIYPLPAASDLDELLAPAESGRGGPLLTRDVFAGGAVPQLDEFTTLPDDNARLAALRVVAFRYDPCAGVLLPPRDPGSCTAQLRLVFQPLLVEEARTRALDGAIHAFYELDSGAAADVEQTLRALRSDHTNEPEVPLGVNPHIAAEGPSGHYATALRALITKHAGAANLTRVTSFARLANARFEWRFAIRARAGSAFADGMVATLATGQQTVTTISGGRWDADLTPASGSPDDPTRLFDVPPAEQADAFKASARVLNPRIHHADSIDCGSCHLAHDIAVFGESTLSLSMQPPDRFTSSLSLEAAPKPLDEVMGLKNLHMLSYLGTTLTVSMRTANETAAVLEYLNAR